MTPLLLSFYLVPAAVVLVAFWAVWRLVRLLDLSVSARRTLFVVIGTMGLAPMLVPAGTIIAAWVPHGLLLLRQIRAPPPRPSPGGEGGAG